MSQLETRADTAVQARAQTQVEAAADSPSVRSNCPDCGADLALFRIIPGRADCEYWTMRCTRCGGIHLDIVKPAPKPI